MGALPNADLAVIAGAGHLPWLDDPATAAAGVAAFLGRGAQESAVRPAP